jgi:hypothetical protein
MKRRFIELARKFINKKTSIEYFKKISNDL